MSHPVRSPRLGIFRAGIRRRLFLLAVSLTLPIALIAVARAVERLRTEQRIVGERSLSMARRAAQLVDADVNATRAILTAVSRLLKPSDPIALNDSLLRFVFDQTSIRLTNVFIADTLGQIHGSLQRVEASAALPNLRGTGPFDTVLRTRSYSIGRAIRSMVLPDRGWVIPVAMPILDDNGSLRGVAGASIPIDSMAAVLLARDLPTGSVLTILQSDGRVFLRTQDLDEWILHPPGDSTLMAFDFAHPDAVTDLQSRDGTRRLVAHAPLSTLSGLLYIGIPVSATLDVARRQFLIDLLIGAIGTLIFVGFALYTAGRIAEPLLDLTNVARAIGRGEDERRARPIGNDEVAELGRALNQLVDAVHEREQQLQASETRYRRLFATSPLPIVTWRLTDGGIEQVNDAAEAFFGLAELREGIRILDLLVEEERDAFADLPAPDAHATMRAGQWTMRGAGGVRRQIELFVSAVERGGEALAVGILIDVTDRRRAELALEQSREQLRQAQKLEALGAFAGGIAHDFNNYLSAIATNAELLRNGLPPQSALHAEAEEILGAAQRASALTRQILVFSRRQVVHDQDFDVNAALRSLERMVLRLVGEGIQVRMVCAPNAPHFAFDHGRLEQIIMNLAANARDAMLGGGVLTISSERTADHHLRLRVRDSGVGMPSHVLSRIFEPFYTTKPRERGTGLGLAMVYSIVTAARGTIVVESTVGQGTEFVLTFPGLLDANACETTAAPPVQVPGGKESILLVEDEPAVRTATAALLSRAGYLVTVAESAATAKRLLAEMSEPPALVLTDVVMPQESGPELAIDLNARFPNIRILFMSGYADDDLVIQGVASNSIHFVAKPFSAAELLGAIRRLLDGAAAA